MNNQTPIVEMYGISKAFAGVSVLEGVDLDLFPGEVHALLGGNGAGKSTLMKILQGVGVYTPDAGEIRIGGEPVRLRGRHPQVAMIFQEFSLIPTLSVAQNVYLTREPRGKLGTLADREAERQARRLFEQIGVDLDPRARMDSLSTAYWQLTEMAKALAQDARVLVMDEPTASLARSEAEALFALIARLKERGIGIVYISHRLQEVLQLADRVTVLRDGRVVATVDAQGLTTARAIELIVGRKVEETMRWRPRTIPEDAPPLLEVQDLVAGPRVRGVTFEVRAGEIVGLAGLMGSGRTELAHALFGIQSVDSGTVLVRGRPVKLRTPEVAIDAGIALIPEDRRVQGLILDHSVRSNLTLTLLQALSEHGVMRRRKEEALAKQLGESLKITSWALPRPARLLSGGNQQKVVIAKWLGRDPDILVMDEPTAGIDVGTKAEIIEIIRRLADGGKAIIVISSEFVELLASVDRVLVVKDGVVAGAYDRKDIAGEEELHALVQAA
jgi:ribose transport system ATP-binding protein